MIDTRLDQVAGHGLTPAQTGLYREASANLFAAFPSEASQAARAAVIAEAPGGTGEDIARLIERSVRSRDDADLRLIGAYNATAPDGGDAPAPVPFGPLGSPPAPLGHPSTDDDGKKTPACLTDPR